MSGSLQYSFPENGSEVLKTLNSFRENRYLCDVVVAVGDKKYLAHSLVLAASSKVIQSQIQGAPSPGTSILVISLDNVDSSIMATIIEFFYLSTISVNIENVWMLLPAACALQLRKVVKLCCDYLSSIMASDSCFRIRRLAAEHSCTQLVRICDKFIQGNFSKILSAATFKTFSLEDIMSILTDLQGSLSKDQKMQAVGKWLEHRTETTRQQVLSTVVNKFPDLGERLQPALRASSFASQQTVDEEQAVFICDDCDWIGYSQIDHDQHALLHSENAPSSSLDNVAFNDDSLKSDIINVGPYQANDVEICSSGLPYGSINKTSIQSSVPGILSHIHEKSTYRCTICGKEFASKFILRSHRRSHVEITSYQDSSTVTAMKTPSRELCNTSRIDTEKDCVKEETEKLYCTVRQGKFQDVLISDAYSVTSPEFTSSWHNSYPDELKNHNCEFCGKRFPSKTNLCVHRRIHTGERPHGCEFCGKRFTQRTHLIYHRRSHTGERPFSCTICRKAFSRSEILRNHMKRHITSGDDGGTHHEDRTNTHKDVTSYSCIACPEVFNNLHMLEKHRLIHVKQQLGNELVIDEVISLSRPRCLDQLSGNDPITNDSSLLFQGDDSEDIQDNSNSEVANIVCSICSTTVSNETAFKKHLKDHGLGDDSPYVADPESISNYSTGSTNSVNRAETSMSQSYIRNIKGNHSCSVCNKVCLSPFNLKSHMRTHTGERPYKCEVCNKRFIQCSHMRNHMRQHTGERPFKCGMCAKCFTRKNILRAHMDSHAGNYKFIKCRGCGGSYSCLMQAERSTNNPLSLCVDCLALSQELSMEKIDSQTS